jgi:hypothetical protein
LTLRPSAWAIAVGLSNLTLRALTWLVTGNNGENVIRAEGATRAEAYGRACIQAREVGMLAARRPR